MPLLKPVQYRNKETQSSTRMLQYWTEMMNAGMPVQRKRAALRGRSYMQSQQLRHAQSMPHGCRIFPPCRRAGPRRLLSQRTNLLAWRRYQQLQRMQRAGKRGQSASQVMSHRHPGTQCPNQPCQSFLNSLQGTKLAWRSRN
jgi:hypothetical protein